MKGFNLKNFPFISELALGIFEDIRFYWTNEVTTKSPNSLGIQVIMSTNQQTRMSDSHSISRERKDYTLKNVPMPLGQWSPFINY